MAPSVNSTCLATAIKTISKALSLTTASSTVSLQFYKGKLWISGCKGHLSSTLSFTLDTVPNGSSEEWKVDVYMRGFKEAVGCFPSNTPLSISVESKSDDEHVVLTSVSGKNCVKTCKPELQVAPFVKLDSPKSWRVHGDTFIESVKTTAFAASSDTVKQALAGVNFVFSSKGLKEVVATDGHRLSDFFVYPEASGEEYNMVIMAKPLQELTSLVKKYDCSVNMAYQPGKGCSLSFSYSGTEVMYNQGETPTYPATGYLFPERYAGCFTVDQRSLLKELEQVAKVVRYGNNTVILDVSSEGSIRVISHTGDTDKGASYESEIPCFPDTQGIRIGFNVRYLIECLKLPLSKSGVIKFSHNYPTQPVVMTVLGNRDYRYLVMPVQIRSPY